MCRVARKLGDVLRDLTPLVEQGKAAGFLNDAENAQKLNDLMEDIRDAMMDYQVCMSGSSFLQRLMFVPDIVTTRYL